MRVSREEIERCKTANGGYTRETLAKWGIKWPPSRGWKARLISGKDQTDFTLSKEWREFRYGILERDGFRCVLCGRTAADGVKLQVDHIKARSLYPELALDPLNARTACEDCNIGKRDRAA
jgi:5-methylcytosine-specific restriction endonuclease McrA